VAWGFGRYAPEASAGRPIAPVNGLSFRQRRREALAPAPSTKKPAPHGSKRTARTPKAMEALCLYAEPSFRASTHPSLKGYVPDFLWEFGDFLEPLPFGNPNVSLRLDRGRVEVIR